MLTATFFENNRRNLLTKIGADDPLVIITAQSLMQRTGDTVYPFRQDNNFFYLTGIEVPDIILVMCGSEEFLILPKRTYAETVFGGTINCDELAKISGVMAIYSHTEGWNRYKKLQQSRKKLYTIKPAPAKVTHTDSFFTNPARRHLVQKLHRINLKIEIFDLRDELTQMRMIKQPEEILAIQQAIAITAAGIKAVQQTIKPGISEYQLEEALTHQFRLRRTNHAFNPIISAGKNTCILHYLGGTSAATTGDFVLLDVGAEVDNYAADVSRTYAVDKVSNRHQAVYTAVKDAQQQAMALLKPGLEWREWAERVDQIVGEKLVELGLIQNITREAVRAYFSHGIGHSLGLDVHDVCDYKTIQENMVITVEPGIYIHEEGIGVRIEDDVLITKNGIENLSASIPYM